MKKLTLVSAMLLILGLTVFAQNDFTNETKFNLSSSRKVSGSENCYSQSNGTGLVPKELLAKYNSAADSRNEELKTSYGIEIEKYLKKPENTEQQTDFELVAPGNVPFEPDWYNSEVMLTNSDIAYLGGYRQMELKQGEDGWMYLAVNRRNIPGSNGYITVLRSSNGGANWNIIYSFQSPSNFFGSLSLLVESRDNLTPDSTRLFVYFTYSSSVNFDNAGLYCWSFRTNSTGSYQNIVSNPAVGNRYTFPSACSDGMFYQGATYVNVIVREETNAGNYVSLKNFRSINWGVSHTVGTIFTFNDDMYPSAAFSIETGPDSIYIAVERRVAVNESEIRLITTSSTPVNEFSVRYVTDATGGIFYERPCITIQQRAVTQPQHILVTSTKNDRAVYHFSQDGGAAWTVDATLGQLGQDVDFTSCNSDTLSGPGCFIAAMVDLNGDSVMIRRGILGLMGTFQHKMNLNNSTGTLAPVCAIYRTGNAKYSAFSYAGFGPAGLYYNMEGLITGITNIEGNIPKSYSLSQNYPNPFNPATKIEFSLPISAQAKLVVYDMLGRELEVLVNGQMKAGTYKAEWNAANYPSGVYFYKLQGESFSETRKMILVK